MTLRSIEHGMLLLGALVSLLPAVPVRAGETLDVSFDTRSHGGHYAPDNVVVVWIEDAGGGFVRTILRRSQYETDDLLVWSARSGVDADAVTGATRTSHAQRLSTVTWDLRDRNGQLVPDGTYYVWIEMTEDEDATGEVVSFPWTKDGVASTATHDGTFITNVFIDYSGYAPSPGAFVVRGVAPSVDEAAGSVRLEVARADGAVGAVSVDYATVAGSATAGADFVAQSGTFSFADGEATARVVTVPILDDNLVEAGETFDLVLSAPSGGAALGTPASLTVTIRDDDAGAGSADYSEDFDRYDVAAFSGTDQWWSGYVADPWTTVGTGGVRCITDDGHGTWGSGGAANNHLVQAGFTWSDFLLEVDATSSDDDAFGVVFRFRDGLNFYLAFFTNNAQPQLDGSSVDTTAGAALYRVVDGTGTLLARSTAAPVLGVPHRVRVEAVGDAIAVSLDGVVELTATDAVLTDGAVGFYALNNGGATFDDLTVTAVSAPLPGGGGAGSSGPAGAGAGDPHAVADGPVVIVGGCSGLPARTTPLPWALALLLLALRRRPLRSTA